MAREADEPSGAGLPTIEKALATPTLFDVAVIVNEYVVLFPTLPRPFVEITPVVEFNVVLGGKDPDVTA